MHIHVTSVVTSSHAVSLRVTELLTQYHLYLGISHYSRSFMHRFLTVEGVAILCLITKACKAVNFVPWEFAFTLTVYRLAYKARCIASPELRRRKCEAQETTCPGRSSAVNTTQPRWDLFLNNHETPGRYVRYVYNSTVFHMLTSHSPWRAED